MENTYSYPIPPGVHAIPAQRLDTRSDEEIDATLLNPPAPTATSDRNIWFFWHSGFATLHAYTRRNVRAWHRRFSRSGWVIRVVDLHEGSPLHVKNFLDVTDPALFPAAFRESRLEGSFAYQHCSDLVRFPLLLRYGGVYADVGLLQIGDLDRLWREIIEAPACAYELATYNCAGVDARVPSNYFMMARRENEYLARSHRLLLALWAADGGKASTTGMHTSPLLEGAPLMGGGFTMKGDDGRTIGEDECRGILTDYIVQGQALTMVLGLVDAADDWDGPRYAAEKVYAMDYMECTQLINEFTAWDGTKAFRLMSLTLPKDGEEENEEQRAAREIVEACLQRSFAFKLAHGLIIKVFGETLGSLWRKHEGSDDVPGTYAHWLRYGMSFWEPDSLPPRMDFQVIKPYRVGSLLGGEQVRS
nr:hypothetical protein CFP56_37091 [Quercus suber]